MNRGFTLIELMIGLSILGLLIMLALPSFSVMLANQKIRAQAESFANGLQTARTEAVKRNAQVEFLTSNDDTGIAAQVATLNPVAPNNDGNGLNWAVRVQTAPGVYTFVEGRSTTSTLMMSSAPTTASILFSGLGQAGIASTVTYQVTNPASGLCVAASGSLRCLNVTLSPGGQVRICDPSVTAAGDTRKC